jgi:hypothetical protein
MTEEMMSKALAILVCCGLAAICQESEVRFLACYELRLQPGWELPPPEKRVPERLDLLYDPTGEPLPGGGFPPDHGAEMILYRPSSEAWRTPVVKPVSSNHFIRKISLHVHGEQVKVAEAVVWEQDIHGPEFKLRNVTVRLRIEDVPLEAVLIFYPGDTKETLWINNLAAMLSTVHRDPGRSCNSGSGAPEIAH